MEMVVLCLVDQCVFDTDCPPGEACFAGATQGSPKICAFDGTLPPP